MRNPFTALTPRYSSLSSKTQTHSSSLSSSLTLLSILVVTGLSFFLGRHTAPSGSLLTIPLRITTRTFRYDSLFGSPPSNTTDAAWHSLFPTQGGFFKHPNLAPTRSAFAVFHQLHCLDGIRHAHTLLLTAALSNHALVEDDIPFMSSAPHVRHCIDLIRQSLMCRPDTTVEVKDEKVGGVTGFGTEHVCWHWGELIKWTGEWEAWGAEREEEKYEKDEQEGGLGEYERGG